MAQANDDLRPDLQAIIFLPYDLSEIVPERPFDRISWLATKELGEHYPLNTEQLRDLLERWHDTQSETTLAMVRRYTQDVIGCRAQLKSLRLRIMYIASTEIDLSENARIRIKLIKKELSRNKTPPFMPIEQVNSIAFRKALEYIAPKGWNKGNLSRNELLNLIVAGTSDRVIQMSDLLTQLTEFRKRIVAEMDLEKHELALPLNRIRKILFGIDMELAA